MPDITTRVWRGQHITPDDRVPVSDRGLALGDGAFETLRVANGRVFRLADHLLRLYNALRILAISPAWDADRLGKMILDTLAESGRDSAVLRVTVTRGAAERRGLLPPDDLEPNCAIQVYPFTPFPAHLIARGIHAAIVGVRRDELSPLSAVKSLGYTSNVLAMIQARDAGAEEAVLLNTAGQIACASSSNLFVIRNGFVQTPAVSHGALPGIARETVMRLCASLTTCCEEAVITPEDLMNSEEAFLTNVVRGVMPVTSVNGTAIDDGAPGPCTLVLREAFEVHLRQTCGLPE